MSSGKRFKFQGSTIAVVTEFGADSPSLHVLDITKADPAVVETSAAHGLSDGDVVKLSGIQGMTEVNEEVYVIESLTATTFSLVGVDSTNYGTFADSGSASVDIASFSNFCELTGYNRQGGSKTENDASSLCSTAVEVELGLPDYGTTQLDFFFAPRTAIQTALAAFDASGDKLAVKVTLPKSGGEMVQLGFVQQLSEQSAVNGLWTASLTLRNTGARYDIAA